MDKLKSWPNVIILTTSNITTAIGIFSLFVWVKSYWCHIKNISRLSIPSVNTKLTATTRNIDLAQKGSACSGLVLIFALLQFLLWSKHQFTIHSHSLKFNPMNVLACLSWDICCFNVWSYSFHIICTIRSFLRLNFVYPLFWALEHVQMSYALALFEEAGCRVYKLTVL